MGMRSILRCLFRARSVVSAIQDPESQIAECSPALTGYLEFLTTSPRECNKRRCSLMVLNMVVEPVSLSPARSSGQRSFQCLICHQRSIASK